jgi:hypothetical protein
MLTLMDNPSNIRIIESMMGSQVGSSQTNHMRLENGGIQEANGSRRVIEVSFLRHLRFCEPNINCEFSLVITSLYERSSDVYQYSLMLL